MEVVVPTAMIGDSGIVKCEMRRARDVLVGDIVFYGEYQAYDDRVDCRIKDWRAVIKAWEQGPKKIAFLLSGEKKLWVKPEEWVLCYDHASTTRASLHQRSRSPPVQRSTFEVVTSIQSEPPCEDCR
jgi:hypothetical protein